MVVVLLLPIALLPPLPLPETAAPLLLIGLPLPVPEPELLLLVCALTALLLLLTVLLKLLPMALLLLLLLELVPPLPPTELPLVPLPGRKLPAVEEFPTTPALEDDEELEVFGTPAAVALELLPDEDNDDDDFPEAFDLRCLNVDETLLPPALPPPLERLEKPLLPPPPPPNVLLVILMLVADVEAEFIVESISFSGDEHESEEVSCCMGLYGGIVLTLPPFFCNIKFSKA